jgi:hypothetical protein
MRLILTIVILAILFASNPGLNDHQKAVKAKISQFIKKQTSSRPGDNQSEQAGKVLLGLVGESMANEVINEVIKRKDYFFFSLTTFEFNGNEKIIGIGIFGEVFISNEIEKELNNYVKKVKSSFDSPKGSTKGSLDNY